MRLLPLGLVCLLLFNVSRAAGATASGDANGVWIARFRGFAGQKNIEMESSYSPRSGNEKVPSFSELLRALPEPQEWQQLRKALAEAVSKVPEQEKVERQRLQAANWLLAYLVGDHAAIESDIGTALKAAGLDEHGQATYALNNLQKGLLGREGSNQSRVQGSVEEFESQLLMLEPVNETAVKQTLGGEENLARLKRVVALGREMQGRYEQIYKEYETTKDEPAARAKAEALQKEYIEKSGSDQEVIEPHLNHPLVKRYMQSLFQETMGDSSFSYVPTLEVPDLVAMVGRERASELLRRALRAPVKLESNAELGEATRTLLRELILAEIDRMKNPSWGLLRDAHSAELFEAFQHKFLQVTLKEYDYRNACGYYLASLILQGRAAEAVKFVTELRVDDDTGPPVDLPYDVVDQLEQRYPDELWQFLRGWLVVKPGVREWDRFNRLSAQLDRGEEVRGLIKAMAESGAFNGVDRLTVQRMQADAEMATGEIINAVQRLNGLVQTPSLVREERSAQLDILQRLLKLADLQDDQAGFTHTLAQAETLLAVDRAGKSEDSFSSSRELVATLGGLGRHADSARLAGAELDRIPALEKDAETKKDPDGNPLRLSDYGFHDLLGEKLRADVNLGHWSEARELLQKNSWWGAKDVAGLLNRTLSCRGNPVGYYVARVVQADGDTGLARRILEAQLVATPAVDAVYEAYLGLVGQEALPLLDKLAASDHYEERPLIWKARLQMDAKQWDVAVATLQQAITIDPSDGEQGHGDRMRVYAFMSLATAAKGDTEKATFFANVVKAIRLSETADRWYEIGAYSKAIELYRQALGFFQDAYCIQSRLAIRLADAGKMDEAVEHYRHAFELMPDSFGRVESHCFGCEHVFAGKKSQSVAEEVFARMLQARPDKPQLHYLSGYLREEQERLPEAAEGYRRAVQLDPLYLNAWNRLRGLDRKLNFSLEQRDELSIKLLELDPGQKHVSPDLEKMSDLPRLWRALKETREVLSALPRTGDLWKLEASAARIAKVKADESSWVDLSGVQKDFATVMLGNDFIEALQIYFGSLSQIREQSDESVRAVETE